MLGMVDRFSRKEAYVIVAVLHRIDGHKIVGLDFDRPDLHKEALKRPDYRKKAGCRWVGPVRFFSARHVC